MSNSNFAQAIEKIVNAPADEVFEAAMDMFRQIQLMHENEVVAFWRATWMFYELNPGRNTSPSPVLKHLLETAWARMETLQRNAMGDQLDQIEHIFLTYGASQGAA